MNRLEWGVSIVIFLIVARLFWAEKAARSDNSFFESIGLGGGAKYLVTVPLGIWVCYRLFRREQAKAEREGIKVVRPQVLAVSLGVLALAIVFLVLTAAS